jgi:hypothetical protein
LKRAPTIDEVFMNLPQLTRSRYGFELELGPELAFYRRRPRIDIFRSLGQSVMNYYLWPIWAVWAAGMLSAPFILLAQRLGVPPPIVKDPVWGPILYTSFAAWFLAFMWLFYLQPRRAFLTIHKEGFAVQKFWRRHLIRYHEIVECQAINSTATLSLQLADGRRLSWKGFYNVFPPEGVEQLLNLIAEKKGGVFQVSEVDQGFRRNMRIAGIAVGLIIMATVALAPVCDEKGRAILRKGFGARFCGLPSEVSVPLLFAVLFAPFIFVFPHAIIAIGRLKGRPQAMYHYTDAEGRRSVKIAVAGLIYFIALAATWAAYAQTHGL